MPDMNLTELQALAAQQHAGRETARAFADSVRASIGSRIQWIRLFGSLARGDWMGADESDIDVAVIVRDMTDEDARTIVRLASAQTWQTGFVISRRVFSPVEFAGLQQRELRLARDILDEGFAL